MLEGVLPYAHVQDAAQMFLGSDVPCLQHLIYVIAPMDETPAVILAMKLVIAAYCA
jgi:alkylhydroperoxidase/carboxymuconolactone decarboxylase family protein YurZ